MPGGSRYTAGSSNPNPIPCGAPGTQQGFGGDGTCTLDISTCQQQFRVANARLLAGIGIGQHDELFQRRIALTQFLQCTCIEQVAIG